MTSDEAMKHLKQSGRTTSLVRKNGIYFLITTETRPGDFYTPIVRFARVLELPSPIDVT